MRRRTILLLMCMLLILGVVASTGCTEKKIKQSEYPLKLYFVSNEYIDTGDEGKVLVKYEGISVFADEGTDDQYHDAIEMLYDIPEELKNVDTVVTDRIGISDVYVEDGTAFVDINGQDLTGGSLEESLFISQIVETLVNSFEEIKSVQFLVDGEVSESLMGHFDATEPYENGLFE